MIGVKVKLLVQIGIVFGICLLGELIAKLLPFVFPSRRNQHDSAVFAAAE